MALYRALSAAALGLTVSVSAAGELVGQVVSIHDGDTLTVLIDQRQVKVRLASIDAPELGQPFGRRSRQSLAEICHLKQASIAPVGRDRYGRTIGEVACNNVPARSEQIRRGMAWVFERYAPKDSALYGLQAEAQSERRGLWADPRPVAPWDWRQSKRVTSGTQPVKD